MEGCKGVKFSNKGSGYVVECFAIMSLYLVVNRTIARCTGLIILIKYVVVEVIWYGIMYSGMFYNMFIFSCFHTRKLQEWARNRMVQRRQNPAQDSYRFLVPQLSNVRWGEGNALDKRDIVMKIVGDGVRPKMGSGKDSQCMEKYLETVDPTGLQDPEITSWESFIPCKAPLLDYLTVSIEEKEDNWRFPRLKLLKDFQEDRGLSKKLLVTCAVREIVVGETKKEEILEIWDWTKEQLEKDQVSFPCNALSLDVEDQQMSLYDVYRMCGKIPLVERKRLLARKLEDTPRHLLLKDKWRQVPAKIMFGDGRTWMVVISLDLGWSGTPWLSRQSVQKELVDFIEGLPICVGLGIKADFIKIEEFYSLLADRPVKMRGFVDLAVLAALAGWRMNARGMTCMGVQVIGTVLNKCVSTGDFRWGQKWQYLTDALQVYGIGDIKFGYITVTVLLGLLLRDFFPDPDVLCKQLRLYQDDAARWFCDLILTSCINTELDGDAAKSSRTRESLIRSIRYCEDNGSRSKIPSAAVQMLENLLGDWPFITNGGCRFLLQARYPFLHQVEVIQESQMTWSNGERMKNMDEDDIMYLLFGMKPLDLCDVDWSDGVSSTNLGLLRAPMQVNVLQFDPSSTSDYRVIVRQCKDRDLPQRGAILEWARLNTGQIPGFILQMQGNDEFRGWFKSYYDSLRLMFKRLVQADLPFIPELESELRRNFLDQVQTEKNKFEESLIVVEERRERVEWLNDGLAHLDMLDRCRLLHRMPQFSVKRGAKRGRSRSRSKSRTNQPSKKVYNPVKAKVIHVEILSKEVSRKPKAPLDVKMRASPKSGMDVGSKFNKVLNQVPEIVPAPGSDDVPAPGPSSGSPECRIPPVVVRKGGKTTVVSYDDYLEKQFSRDSSSDEEFQFKVPNELLKSFLA